MVDFTLYIWETSTSKHTRGIFERSCRPNRYIQKDLTFDSSLDVVIGKAIECPKLGKNISQRDIDEYHQLFLNELQKLFDRHKQYEELYESRELKIS